MSHVMIVDDDPDILRLVKTRLEKAGFEVSEAESAESALAKMAERKPDLGGERVRKRQHFQPYHSFGAQYRALGLGSPLIQRG